MTTCRRCGVDLSKGARFCTMCGASTAVSAAPEPVENAEQDTPTVGDEAVSRLVECASCGASNAASRPLCARCGSPLRDEVPGGDALPDPQPREAKPEGVRVGGFDTSPMVLGLVILAGLVTAGVLLALVTSQVRRGPTPAVPVGILVSGAEASSALGDNSAALAVDGDTATAWVEAASGDGAGEYLDVLLLGEEEIRRILVWNGDQASETAFSARGRAASLHIEVAGRQFRVALLDIDGPQAVDLPAGLVADRVRLVVEESVGGGENDDLAISEVVIEAAHR